MNRLITSVATVLVAAIGGGHLLGLELSAADASNQRKQQNGATAPGLTQSVVEALKQRDQQTIEQRGAAAYGALVAALKHEDQSVRADAAYYLGRLRDPRATDMLLALCEDPSAVVRRALPGALAGLADPRAVEALVALLDDPDSMVRSSAALAVGQVRDPQAFESLVGLLKHPDDAVRRSAAKALGELNDSRAVQPLVAALSDPHWWVRTQAATALEQLHWRPDTDRLRALRLVALAQYEQAARLGPPAVAPLFSVLRGTSGLERRGAAEALARMGWQPEDDLQRAYYLAALERWPEVAQMGANAAVEPLLLGISSPALPLDPNTKQPSLSASARQRVSQSAQEALKSLGTAAIPPLCAALQSPNREIRRTAARMLGTWRDDPRVVSALVQALKDPDATTRSVAAGALGALRDPQAVESLIEALQDRDAGTRRNAAGALGKLDDPRAIGPLIEALEDQDPDVRWSAGYALTQLKAQGVTEQLVARLSGPDARSRALAAETLARMRDARAIEPTIALLNDPNPEVRRIAVGTLGSLRDPRTVAPLIGRLQDPDGAIRSSAATALWRQGDRAAVEPLVIAFQKEEDKEARGAIALALAYLGGNQAGEALRAALKHKDGSENADIAYALAQLKDADAVGPLIAALKNPDSEYTGMFVVGSLLRMGTAAVEPLIPLLEDGDPQVRCLAAWVLGEIPDPRLVEPLIGALQDAQPGVVQSAAAGLVLLDDQRAVAPLVALLQDPSSPLVQPQRGSEQAQATPPAGAAATNSIKAATLLRCLDDASQPGRQEIAAWLSGRLGVKQAADRLFALLAGPHPDPLVVAQALLRLQDPRGVEPLLTAVRRAATELDLPSLEDSMAAPAPTAVPKPGTTTPSWEAAKRPAEVKQDAEAAASAPTPRVERLEWTMARGAEVLVSLGPPAVEPLLHTLVDQQPRMRVFAANTLGWLGDARAAGPLSAALNDPDERVRSAAAAALRQIQSRPGAQLEGQRREPSTAIPLPTVLDEPEEPESRAATVASPREHEALSDPLNIQCQQNLRELYAGIQAYQKSHGDTPGWLSDLVPQYIANTNLFVCPTQTETIATYPGLEDPRIQTSYTYDFCAREVPNTVWGGSRATMRDWKNRQRRLYGDAVPMIRCTHHDRVLNVSYGGELFESSVTWESDERFRKLSGGRESGPGK